MVATDEQTNGQADEFDPRRFLIDYSGNPYMLVEGRVAWLRRQHPGASIVTELIEHAINDRGQGWAMFRATVTLPDGGSATGWGTESGASAPSDYVERAETGALGRALEHLGYGTAAALGPAYTAPQRESKGRRQQGQQPPAELAATAKLPAGDGKPLQESQERAIKRLAGEAGIGDRLDDWLGVPLTALAANQAGDVIGQLDRYVRSRKAAAASN